MKTFAILIALILLVTIPIHPVTEPVNAQADKCAPFDAWIGGERFNYTVDAQGKWNLPDDAESMATISFPKAAIWKYYSASQDSSYVIVFLSLEPTQPAGQPAGQHDICVYKLPGLGMGG